MCRVAAQNGQLETLRVLHEPAPEPSPRFDFNVPPADTPVTVGSSTCLAAASRGRLEILQWAHSAGCEWDERTCQAAATGGHMEVLQWVRGHGCPWDHTTCRGAAESGNLDMLQWARLNGCPWEADTCDYAAAFGHLEILKWAREHGCPWTRHAVDWAMVGNHSEVQENGGQDLHWGCGGPPSNWYMSPMRSTWKDQTMTIDIAEAFFH